MDYIKQKLYETGIKKAELSKKIMKEHGDVVLPASNHWTGSFGTKRDRGFAHRHIQTPDPEEGIRFRGYTIPELRKKLPKIKPDGEPLPEGLFYLMLMGELPSSADVEFIRHSWTQRAQGIPSHVFDVINALPKSSHPMIQLNKVPSWPCQPVPVPQGLLGRHG